MSNSRPKGPPDTRKNVMEVSAKKFNFFDSWLAGVEETNKVSCSSDGCMYGDDYKFKNIIIQ